MTRAFPEIDSRLQETEADAFLQTATAADPDQRYLTGFGSVDPFTSLYYGGQLSLLVRGLDVELAKEESLTTSVVSPTEYDYEGLRETYDDDEAEARVIKRFCADHDVSNVLVPPQYPIGSAEYLREFGLTVLPDRSGTIPGMRAIKTPEEIAFIQEAQQATEAAMHRVETLLREATIEDGTILHDETTLTSEFLKAEIERTLIRHGCSLEETIVASGSQGANPHDRGSGPLEAHTPIVVDIFPRHKGSKYHADMTRTFCVGEPSAAMQERYDLTLHAFEAACKMLAPGVTGEAVHNAVCDVYEEAGYPTARSTPGTSVGFTHGTGHGVGLEVHESPRVSSGGQELVPGHVITIEPGLYHPQHGGIRIEDLLVITEDGFENLTTYPKAFVL